jgi:hypothetical protein
MSLKECYLLVGAVRSVSTLDSVNEGASEARTEENSPRSVCAAGSTESLSSFQWCSALALFPERRCALAPSACMTLSSRPSQQGCMSPKGVPGKLLLTQCLLRNVQPSQAERVAGIMLATERCALLFWRQRSAANCSSSVSETFEFFVRISFWEWHLVLQCCFYLITAESHCARLSLIISP